MISDVLSDAVASVRDYLKTDGEFYGGDKAARAWIESVVQSMEALRYHLDENSMAAMEGREYKPL